MTKLVGILDAILSCVPAADIQRLAELHKEAEYAGAQLGTSSQAAATTALHNFQREIFTKMPEHYVRETEQKVARAINPFKRS